MAAPIVNEIASLINNQIDTHEQMQDRLLKAEALALIALSPAFYEHGQATVSEYLAAMYDFITESKTLNDAALDGLIKCGRENGLLG